MYSRFVVAAILLVSLTFVAAGVESVPPKQDDSHPVKDCGEGQEWSECKGCDPTCDNLEPICTLDCRPGCKCIKGLVRSGKICISQSKCPKGCVDPHHNY